MASFDELVWTEYSDFTAGLYERGTDRSCPPNGLLECQDCYPQASGGLRATGVWQAMTTTNIPTNGYILNVGSVRGGGPENLYILVLVANAGGAGSHTFELFKLTGTYSGGSWTLLGSVTGFPSWWFGNRMTLFRVGGSLQSGTNSAYFNLYGNTTKDGVYKTDGSTVAQAFAALAPTDVSAYQSRLLYTQNAGPIWFTSVGSDGTPSTANGLFPYEEINTNIRCMTPFSPSDLVVHKTNVGVFDIQGDLTSPTVRQMAFTHVNVQMYPAQTDQGLAWTLYADGVYIFDGANWNPISQPIIGCPMMPNYPGSDDIFGNTPHPGEPSVTSLGFGVTGQSCFSQYFLYAGQSYIWDIRTGGWFKITIPESASGTASHFVFENVEPTEYIVHSRNLSMQTGRHPLWFMEANENDLTRATSYSYTLPLIYNQGQQTTLRELEYQLNAFDTSSTVTVTVTHVDATGAQVSETIGPLTIAGSGPQKMRIGIDGHPSDWWKVRTVLASGTSAEAPMLEKMFTATDPATRYEKAN